MPGPGRLPETTYDPRVPTRQYSRVPGPDRPPETTYDPQVLTRQARGIRIFGYQNRVDHQKLPTTLESLLNATIITFISLIQSTSYLPRQYV